MHIWRRFGEVRIGDVMTLDDDRRWVPRRSDLGLCGEATFVVDVRYHPSRVAFVRLSHDDLLFHRPRFWRRFYRHENALRLGPGLGPGLWYWFIVNDGSLASWLPFLDHDVFDFWFDRFSSDDDPRFRLFFFLFQNGYPSYFRLWLYGGGKKKEYGGLVCN